MSTTSSVLRVSRAYDATALLGFGPASKEPLPKAKRGEIIFTYDGWTLPELCDSVVGRERMDQESRYEEQPWSNQRLPAGIYRLHIPTSDQTRNESGPVVLVATALIVHCHKWREELLKGDWIRCRERMQYSDPWADDDVALNWRGDGRLQIGDIHDAMMDVISPEYNGRQVELWPSSVSLV